MLRRILPGDAAMENGTKRAPGFRIEQGEKKM
jgi:hypothetical protein